MFSNEIRKILETSSVVRFNEIVRRVKSKEYAKQVILRLIRKNQACRIKKGLFSASDDILSVSSNIYYPSYLSFLSASQYYGLTEVIPRIVYIATLKRHNPIEFMGYSLHFVYLKELFGYHKEGRNRNVIFVVDLEKLMIDAFVKPLCMGNFGEIENIFRNIKKINKNKLIEYLKKVQSEKVYRQVGYMAEKYLKLDINGAFQINRNYYNLNPFQKGKELNKKWRLKI